MSSSFSPQQLVAAWTWQLRDFTSSLSRPARENMKIIFTFSVRGKMQERKNFFFCHNIRTWSMLARMRRDDKDEYGKQTKDDAKCQSNWFFHFLLVFSTFKEIKMEIEAKRGKSSSSLPLIQYSIAVAFNNICQNLHFKIKAPSRICWGVTEKKSTKLQLRKLNVESWNWFPLQRNLPQIFLIVIWRDVKRKVSSPVSA